MVKEYNTLEAYSSVSVMPGAKGQPARAAGAGIIYEEPNGAFWGYSLNLRHFSLPGSTEYQRLGLAFAIAMLPRNLRLSNLFGNNADIMPSVAAFARGDLDVIPGFPRPFVPLVRDAIERSWPITAHETTSKDPRVKLAHKLAVLGRSFKTDRAIQRMKFDHSYRTAIPVETMAWRDLGL